MISVDPILFVKSMSDVILTVIKSSYYVEQKTWNVTIFVRQLEGFRKLGKMGEYRDNRCQIYLFDEYFSYTTFLEACEIIFSGSNIILQNALDHSKES